MRHYDPKKALISIHVPKCGGTSLKKVLEEWFGEKLFFHYYGERKGKPPLKRELETHTCIHGHFNKKRRFGVQDYYPQAQQFITILRDPFEIVASRYFYVKRMENQDMSFRNGKDLRLPSDALEYLEKEIQNPDYHPNILDYMPVQVTLENYKEIIERYFIYIGIVEDIQFSVERLADKLGFPPSQIERLNESRWFQEIPAELKERFKKNHPLEDMFYQYVWAHYRKW